MNTLSGIITRSATAVGTQKNMLIALGKTTAEYTTAKTDKKLGVADLCKALRLGDAIYHLKGDNTAF